MANHRAFKSDESFLEKISMGAIGTNRVFEDLIAQDHNPLELERGSMSFKIWKGIKRKGLRVPDILCVACGRRFESRAKKSFEISMSHSLTDQARGWDFGLENSDFVALVVCNKIGDRPIDWQPIDLVQYIQVRDLRCAYIMNCVKLVEPKGAQEGFERRIVWPSSVAKYNGIIISVTNDSVKYRRSSDQRVLSLRLLKNEINLTPLVHENEEIVANQAIAAVVPIYREVGCPRNRVFEYYLNDLTSLSLTERYGAAKALSVIQWGEDVNQALTNRVGDVNDDIYVRLEAAASLARHGIERGYSFIEQCLSDEYLVNRLEAIIILGEIHTERSRGILTNVLMDGDQNSEIRAGAAWALGELNNNMGIDALISGFTSVNEGIRIEAARALYKLASSFLQDVLQRFPQSTPEQRPGIAWALSKASGFQIGDLLNMRVDEDARHWIAYMIGTQAPGKYIQEIERLRDQDSEIYFAVTVLWKIMASWVFGLEEY